MKYQTIPIARILFDARNPRTDAEEGLEELATSMRGGQLLVQPPIVLPDGETYRVLVGERRIRAARLAGAEEIFCLVQDESIDALEMHTIRVVENLHRQALNPIDHAAALRLSWLLANAKAMHLHSEAEAILQREANLLELIPEVEALLRNAGFTPTAPAVTWNETLDSLGIAMTPDRRKKLLRILSIPQDVQIELQKIDISEAAVRSLGRLEEDQQRQIASKLVENPELARSVRRIARAINDQDYSVEEAIAEAEGRSLHADFEESEEEEEISPPEDEPQFEADQEITDAVLAFLEAANQLVAALDKVRNAAPDLLDIPEPWRAYFQQSLTMLEEEIH